VWSYEVVAPGFVQRVEVPDDSRPLQEGQVRLRVLVAGLCGSDMPRLNGAKGKSPGGGFGGAPVHEVVGEVLDSASPLFQTSQHVVGTLGPLASLSEVVTCSDATIIPVPDGFDDVDAVAIQPVGTVLRAAGQFPAVRGRTAAVIGAGPCGLSFCHVLKQRGVATLTVVDPVERSETAKAYGADEFFATTGRDWRNSMDGHGRPEVGRPPAGRPPAGRPPAGRPEIVVEAVGHQNETVVDAIWAAEVGGFVYGFGEVTDPDYVIPCRQIYEKALTFASGRTNGEWPRVLREGATYLAQHKEDFATYISHVVPLSEAQRAYSLYARPQAGRLKVAIVTSG
jgi:L-iditol 2-dehydrogenase